MVEQHNIRIIPVVRYSNTLKYRCHCIRFDVENFTNEKISLFRGKIAHLLEQQPTNLALDFVKVEHIDAGGIEYLVLLKREVASYGGNLILYNIKSKLYRLLEMTQVTRLINIHQDSLALSKKQYLAS